MRDYPGTQRRGGPSHALTAVVNKIRVLVVDDDPRIAELLRAFLQKTDRFDVRVELRPTQALRAAREFGPAVVLLDVDMPGKDGGAVAAEIRATTGFAEVPILFLTSLLSPTETGGRQVFRGGEWFLAKPPNANLLVEAIECLLSGQPAPTGTR